MLTWGRSNFAPYPWRSSRTSPWLGLAAEVLLQRTRAEQVIPVYEEFARRYPHPNFLVRESLPAFKRVVGPLGLHWRAPLIREMARQVSRRGTPPDDLIHLLELPGVGPYAASAYLSFHRDIRAVLVDSNIVRWLGRVFGFKTSAESRRKRWLLDLADQLTPRRGYREYNYAVLDLSMKICRTKPLCSKCPLNGPACQFSQGVR